MKMKSFNFVLFLIFFFVSSASAGKMFVIGVESLNYFPIYDGSSSKFSGCAREILDDFADAYNYEFIYKALPIKRLYKSFLETDELDFKFPDNSFWSSKAKEGKEISYSKDVIYYIDGVLVTPENKNIGLDKVDILGIVRGFTPWEYLGRLASGNIELDEVDYYKSLLKKTILGRTKGCYSNIAVAKYHLKETLQKPDSLIFSKNLPHTKSGYKLSSIKHPEIIKKFDDWLFVNKELVNQIKTKYQAEAGVK